jgi:hypothetical protein
MDPKSLSADFRDFLKSLGDHGVNIVRLVIGGWNVRILRLSEGILI